jgi:hypothetical protein
MVAASATAILININLSAPAIGQPSRARNPMQLPQNAGFAHAFLTARVNRMVSTAAPPATQRRQKKECWKQSKCPGNNPRRQTDPEGRLAPDKWVTARGPKADF